MLNNESNPTVSQLSYFDFPFDLDLIIPLLNLCSFRKTEQDNLIKLQRYFHYFGVRAMHSTLSIFDLPYNFDFTISYFVFSLL